MKIKLTLILVSLISLISYPQDSIQTFLSLSNTGVSEFLQQHPEYDGRGTIIIVMDTGVDMGVDGLTHTSTGEVKVIDVQDFTGEGDVELYPTEIEEEGDKTFFINEEMNYKVAGADKLTYLAVDEKYYIGAFKESALINADSGADLNGNGNETDEYMIVCFKTLIEDGQLWLAYLDKDNDGDISDEIPIHSYKDYKESFSIETSTGLPPLTMGLNIFPDENKVTIHFDDGSHGTHVAGIAAGNNIGGTGLNGVAPGAYVISCKLGNNNYSGGATVTESMKKSFLYADKISKETEMPCIINLSFGIGSEIEARSDMEIFIDQLIKENPYLYVSKSNGNDGPGLSTIGLPSASSSVFSSGAVLPEESGRDLYGTTLGRDIILHFSSRGGEVNKPDLVSPGAMTSTVPNWTGNDRFWGTSMSSPYTAGAMALLLSAVKTEFPDVKIPSHLLYTALKESATNMEGYSYLDQGSGYINVPAAYGLLKKYVAQGEVNKIETYSITTIAPNMPDSRASNLYLRDGSFLQGDEKFNFTVKRNNFQNVNKFYRVYNITTEEEWLKPVQKNVYIRNDQAATITVMFDKSKMAEPGSYSGKIKAYRNDASKFPEFEMLVTVIIPYDLPGNNFKMEWKNNRVNTGAVDRYFIDVPIGHNSMKVKISRNDKDYSKTRFNIYSPDGIPLYVSSLLYSVDNENVVEKIFYNLDPGVYEIAVEGFFTAEEVSNYDLSVKLFGINRMDGDCISSEDNNLMIFNSGNDADKYLLYGEIIGYRKISTAEPYGDEHFFLPFQFNEGEASKTFKISTSKTDFNKVTDFAMLILDEEGRAVNTEALNFKTGSIDIVNNGYEDKQFRLELIPAFANENESMKISITEETHLIYKESIDVTFAGRNSFTLYPGIMTELQCFYNVDELSVPEDGKLYGTVYFKSLANGDIEAEIPVCVEN